MFKLILVFSGFIVVCAAKYGKISLIDFDLPCSLENGEKGEYAFLTNCPEILRDVKLGATFPKVCEINEICWDVVCCHGKTKYGSLYYLTKRLKSEAETCIIEETGIEGVYRPEKYCPSLIDKSISRDPICPFTICENMVCCPQNTTDVIEIAAKIDYFEETCIFDEVFDYNLAYEGDSCVINIKADGGKNYGMCRPYFKCDDYTNSYDYQSNTFSKNVSLCGYNCCVPMVCCDASSYLSSYYVLEKYKHLPITAARSACLKANPHIENYGIIDHKHIDHIRTLDCKDNSSIIQSKKKLYLKEIGRIFSVDLGYMPLASPVLIWNCEGVMLTKYIVLTTASCLDSSKNGPVVSIRLGENLYEVKKIIKHPQHNPKLFYHDIGLVTTKEEFKFELYHNLACLPETRDVVNEEQLLAGNADSTEKSVMKVVGANHCKSIISKLKQGQLKYGFIDDIQFCAGFVDSTEHCPLKMTGSPLVTQSGVVVGLNLVGRRCEKDQPGSLFESTYPYVRWIETFLK